MARVQNPYIGRAKGSIGTVTLTTLNRQNIAKQKIFDRKKVTTVNQFQRQAALSCLVSFYKSIQDVVNMTYTNRPVVQSPYNAFVSQNLGDNAYESLFVYTTEADVVTKVELKRTLVHLGAGTEPRFDCVVGFTGTDYQYTVGTTMPSIYQGGELVVVAVGKSEYDVSMKVPTNVIYSQVFSITNLTDTYNLTISGTGWTPELAAGANFLVFAVTAKGKSSNGFNSYADAFYPY